MTEQERWAANLRAINARIRRHQDAMHEALREADLALAYMRDATLTPAERLAQLEVHMEFEGGR